jgi:prepilin-type N-terminal cleavage/methylation domain-containing protein
MKNTSGFTLIEILASITIIGILFTIGIVSYTNFNRKQMVVQNAKNIVNVLRQVQSNAISGVKDTSACGSAALGSKILDAWYFEALTTKSYSAYGKCTLGAVTSTFGTQTVIFPATSQITYFLTGVGSSIPPIKFYPVVGGTSGNYIICVKGFGDSSYDYKISVNNMGEINEGGFVVNCL